MFGKNGKTSQKELLRLAIPRRVYGKEHIDYVVGIFEKITKIKHKIKGMRIIPFLRNQEVCNLTRFRLFYSSL